MRFLFKPPQVLIRRPPTTPPTPATEASKASADSKVKPCACQSAARLNLSISGTNTSRGALAKFITVKVASSQRRGGRLRIYIAPSLISDHILAFTFPVSSLRSVRLGEGI